MTGKRVAARLAGAAAACFAYGTFVETRQFVVRRVNVPILPAGAPRLRILHLSDVHAMPRDLARLAFVRTLAGLEPDLVIDTGDNIASEAAIEPLGRAFGRLLERPGAYVFGSNDYNAATPRNPLAYLWHRPDVPKDAGSESVPPALADMLSSGGWANVVGRRVVLDVQGVRIEIRGTDDAHTGRDDYGLVAGPPGAGADVSLGVTHAPYKRILDAMARDGVGLVLAGHTHGGQVCVPGYGALVTNCDLPRASAKGLSEHRTRRHAVWLNVSAGLGQSPYAPFRFACPPEVTLLTLT